MIKTIIKSVSSLLIAVSMALPVSVMPVYAEQTMYYVSTDGSDDGSGTEKSPFKTFGKALSEAKKISGDVKIVLREGKHYVGSDISINSYTSSLTISSYPGEKAVLSAGADIPAKYLRKVNDEDMLSRLRPESRSHIYSVKLSSCGITDYGAMRRVEKDNAATWAAPSFITINEETAPRAQWPNSGYSTFNGGRLDGNSPVFRISEENRADSWKTIEDVWVYGGFYADWADDSAPLYEYNSSAKEFKIQYNFNAGISSSGKCQFLNVFEEIDMPNEWYIDKNTGILYIYLEDVSKVKSITHVTTENNMFNIQNSANITFDGVVFEETCKTAIYAKDSSNISVINSEFKNIGNQAVQLVSCKSSRVENCYIHDMGKGGVFITGGDKKNLTPNNNIVTGCHFERFAEVGKRYCPAISLKGIGDTASYNTIHNSPHSAIIFAGNNNIIEYNDIYDVVNEAGDAGAIYGGRDWLLGGTVIRYNYIHDIPSSDNGYHKSGIYLDDNIAGISIYNNTFSRVNTGVYMHSACYCDVYNNLFTEINLNSVILNNLDVRTNNQLNWLNSKIKPAVSDNQLTDAECASITSETGDTKAIAVIKIYLAKYVNSDTELNKTLWNEKFPYLASMLNCDNPVAPKGNNITNNVSYMGGTGKGFNGQGYAKTLSNYSGNKENEAKLSYTSTSPDTIADTQTLSQTFKDGFTGLNIKNTGCTVNKPERKNFKTISPVNNEYNVGAKGVMLTWEDVSGAEQYKVEIATNKALTENTYITYVDSPYYYYTSNFECGQTYYWKITAIYKDLYRSGNTTAWLSNSDGVKSFTTSASDSKIMLEKIIARGADGIEMKTLKPNTLNIIEFTVSSDTASAGEYTFKLASYSSSGNRYSEGAVSLSLSETSAKGGVGILLTGESGDYMVLEAYKDGALKQQWRVDDKMIGWGNAAKGISFVAGSLKDKNGNSICNVSQASGGTYSLIIANDTASDIKVNIYLAGYKNKAVVWTDTKTITINKNSQKSADLSVGAVTGCDRVCAYIWDDNLSPWTNPIDVE